MEPQTHKFTLKDRDGNPHDYVVTPTPAKKAYKMVVRITSRAASSIAGLMSDDIPGLIKAVSTQGLSADIAEHVSGDAIANNIDRIADVITEIDPLELFENTWRDGKRLANENEFDNAFSRNFGELLEAQIKVGEYNDFLGYGLGFIRQKMAAMPKPKPKEDETPDETPRLETFIER